ncbi:MAG TPA: type IV toxin-antitoxin system AbiEi family antitoxin domain-containing protein [Arthrobacter sp.]|nr:type IV toxin-antitoxin system AbiEi family antitoxin domain-containing protein [Arthrobacter sp.]
MQPTEFLARQGGVARLAHLRRAGFTRSRVNQAVNAGLVLNSRHGVYQLPQANADFVRAFGLNAAVTCVSAADHFSLWILKAPDQPHLAACHRRLPGTVRSHRFSGNVSTLQPPVLPLKDVLLHALQCLPDLEALVMVESAYVRGEIDLDFLRRLLPGARNGRARAVLDLVERGSDSLLETVARVLFRRHGFDVRTQVYLAGIGYVDFLLNGCLIVEIDGVGFHLNKPQFKKDIRRNNVGAATGYRVLRYLYEDVLHRPEEMLAQIRLTLATPPRMPC